MSDADDFSLRLTIKWGFHHVVSHSQLSTAEHTPSQQWNRIPSTCICVSVRRGSTHLAHPSFFSSWASSLSFIYSKYAGTLRFMFCWSKLPFSSCYNPILWSFDEVYSSVSSWLLSSVSASSLTSPKAIRLTESRGNPRSRISAKSPCNAA